MSAFKDAVSKDVKAVFLNLDEFANEHTLNGKTVVCVVDKDLTTAGNSHFEGVFLNTNTIYVDVKDMEQRPVEGQIIRLDGVRLMVRSVSVEEGIYVIVAEENAQ